ncbi:M56 family metallopeptidase [Desulfosporosinus lacus]|uniref:Signal transducer regulating beta-lactamase production, contains metallopeptidase domain n=1 Tax=Desulfosporosinus lacus DSM 15449 TaxID=1121420 RepID=A0A1M5X7P8_9FIRM|nr:M56 family metallopeptidase [Desulfosporosinus lacus]SHH95829.1 Signal transducer regulating beta-lactamase production, contains metallopeptidase domain [Desulfosporosinus lacus DSM 15449]
MNTLQVVFTTILNMSITASFVAIGVIIARLMLKKMPRIFSYALWSAVLIRLILPVSFSSTFSFLTVIKPGTQHTTGALAYVPYNMGLMQTPGIDVGVDSINKVVNSPLPQAVQTASVNPMQIVMAVLSIVWVVGVALLIIYSVISYLKVINNVKTSTLVRDEIFETDRIVTPFVCGFIKPKIYIPTDISQSELPYILAHERVHIKRLDYLIKPFAFLVLSVHWFNPLMWLSFFLMSKDLEMSCDESVLKLFGDDETRANYSKSLLALATGKRQLISGSPLAFGESNTKARIKNVLSYKKPPSWVVVVTLIVTFVLVVLLTANPKNDLLATGVYSGFKTETLLANKTQYVGDNNKVVALIDAMPLPAGVVRNSVELQTSATPYSMTIHYTVSELEGQNNTYAFHNAIMLFSLVDNVDVIYSSILDITNSPNTSTSIFPHTREYTDQLLDGDVRDYANNTKTLIELIDRLNAPPDISKITAQGPNKDQIEAYLATIMSSPLISSNPQDYIKAHETEYNAILAMDHKALTYLFSEFKKGGQNGLKGQIMMNLCRTILGGEDIKTAVTPPQDWYDSYKGHIQRLVNENGIDWVHQKAPKGSLIRL